MAEVPIHEQHFKTAEQMLPLDPEAARVEYERAKAEYEAAGSPKLRAELNERNFHFFRNLMTQWLDDIEQTYEDYGVDEALKMLNAFSRTYRPDWVRFYRAEPQKIQDLRERISNIRKKFQQESEQEPRVSQTKSAELQPEDIEDLKKLKAQIEIYETELKEARDKGLHFDPRVDFGGTGIPLLVLGELKKKAENWIPDKGSSIEELEKRQKILEIINQTDNLVEEWKTEISAIDADFFSTWDALTPVDQASLNTHKSVNDTSLASQKESTLTSAANELVQIKSRIDATKKELSSGYDAELLKRMGDLFGSFNAGPLQGLKEQRLDKLSKEVQKEIDRRQPRIDALVESTKKSSEFANLKTRIREMIAQTEALTKLPTLNTSGVDVIAVQIGPIYEELDKYPDRGNEYKELRKEVLLFDYRQTKRIINGDLENSEINFSGAKTFWFTRDYDVLVKGAAGFGRLERVENELRDFISLGLVDQGLVASLASDRKRFEHEINMRRLIFVAEQSVEKNIWGSVEKGPSRSYPEQTPEIFIEQKNIPFVINPSEEVTPYQELRFSGEAEYNYKLPANKRRIKAHKNFDYSLEEIDFTPTLSGELMRLFDDLYSNRLADKYRKALQLKRALAQREQKEEQTEEEKQKELNKQKEEDDFVAQLRDSYRKIHIWSKTDNLPNMISRCAKMIHNIDVSPVKVKQIWYLHTLFCNQSMLIPQSSPNANDAIYKGNQALNYIVSGVLAGTTPVSIWESGYYFGVRDPDSNLLDELGRVDEDKTHLSKPKNMQERLGYAFASVRTKKNSISAKEKIEEALSKTPELQRFLYLADPPLVDIKPSEFNTFPIIPTVLQYMIFRNEDYKPDIDPETKKDRGNKEEKVVRWKNPDQGFLPPPVCAADYVDSERNILYEEIPWDKVTGTEITDWYNNGSNIAKLYKMIFDAPTDSLLDRNALPGEQNDTKYAASFFPVLGPEVAAGNFNGEKVFRRITIVHVFSRCVTLLAQDKLQLKDIGHKLHSLNDVIGHDAVEAIETALTVAYGEPENLQELRTTYLNQLKEFLKVR